MDVKTASRFALGMALFSPLFALEDGLRYAGVKVPQGGLTHNDQGKSISEIWAEEARMLEVKKALREELAEAMKASGKDAIPTLMQMFQR